MVETTAWEELAPTAPSYLFVSQNADLLGEYEANWSLRDVFSPNGDPAPGIVTTHDDFAISWTADEAAAKVERLLATSSEAEARELFKLCAQDQWRYARAKSELADGKWRDLVAPILYRPFDIRWTVYDRNVAVHRRERASSHMLTGGNLAICTTRSTEISRGWEHVWVSSQLIQHHTVSLKEVNYFLPLWLYRKEPADLLDTNKEKTANLAENFIAAITEEIADNATPEDMLAWIYAVLYAPSYRSRYADFLKRDFPRIPLTSSRELFDRLVAIGHELIALHTMDTTLPRITRFDVAGTNAVVKVRYTQSSEKQDQVVNDATGDPAANGASVDGRVWINDAQCFAGVPQTVWDTHIGGYRVAEKWLKDRKGRQLTYDDLTHYQAVISALSRTLDLQSQIDTAIEQAGGWPLR